jgi:hypothetical protein
LRQMYHRLRNRFGHTRWYSWVTRLKWQLILVRLDIVVILTQDSCTVCAVHIIGSEIIFGRSLRNSYVTWVIWNLILVRLDARWVHGLCQTYLRVRNSFGCTRWYSYVTRLNYKLVLVRLEIVLILTQDRCTVCAERHKSFWTHPMELLHDVGHVKSRFGLFRDSFSVSAT